LLSRRALLFASAALPLAAAVRDTDVTDFGAVGDGTTLNTKALQTAINACANHGGGTVRIPAGRFLSGTLFLKSGVHLYLDAGAVLLGSTRLDDYPVTPGGFRSYTDTYTDKSLIYAENAENIGLSGAGCIDGQGKSFQGPYKVRPYLMRFVSCRDMSMSGVTLKNSPMWVQHYLNCQDVLIHGITVKSHVNKNNDGIDIDCCRRVRISDCDISSGDDGIVLKSTADVVCRDVVVSNCVVSSDCSALKLGTESNGGFENIAFSNCTVYDTRLAGIALEMVDGGTLDRVTVSNIVMNRVGAPIFLRLGNRARPFREGGPIPGMCTFRNVQITNIQATGASVTGCAIAGLPGHPIQDVTIENIRIEFDGGGSAADAKRVVPEYPDRYPEYSMFGRLPAYGFYVRHARGLRFRNLNLTTAKPDGRPPMVRDDVEDASEQK
jgi:polygalacturonase